MLWVIIFKHKCECFRVSKYHLLAHVKLNHREINKKTNQTNKMKDNMSLMKLLNTCTETPARQ